MDRHTLTHTLTLDRTTTRKGVVCENMLQRNCIVGWIKTQNMNKETNKRRPPVATPKALLYGW